MVKVEPITATIARAAAQRQSTRKSLRIPDALVLACGDAMCAEVVLTGDDSWARLSCRVRGRSGSLTSADRTERGCLVVGEGAECGAPATAIHFFACGDDVR